MKTQYTLKEKWISLKAYEVCKTSTQIWLILGCEFCWKGEISTKK